MPISYTLCPTAIKKNFAGGAEKDPLNGNGKEANVQLQRESHIGYSQYELSI